MEAVTPEIDGGRFPAKRVVGETVVVEGDIFTDGQDALAAVLRYRHEAATRWIETPMAPLVNDRWHGEFGVTELGRYVFTIEAWVDEFETWTRQLAKRIAAGQNVEVELEVGAQMVERASSRADGSLSDASSLAALAQAIRVGGVAAVNALPDELRGFMRRYVDRSRATTYARQLEVIVEPEKARFSTWYELFPRSTGPAGKHGTFN